VRPRFIRVREVRALQRNFLKISSCDDQCWIEEIREKEQNAIEIIELINPEHYPFFYELLTKFIGDKAFTANSFKVLRPFLLNLIQYNLICFKPPFINVTNLSGELGQIRTLSNRSSEKLFPNLDHLEVTDEEVDLTAIKELFDLDILKILRVRSINQRSDQSVFLKLIKKLDSFSFNRGYVYISITRSLENNTLSVQWSNDQEGLILSLECSKSKGPKYTPPTEPNKQNSWQAYKNNIVFIQDVKKEIENDLSTIFIDNELKFFVDTLEEQCQQYYKKIEIIDAETYFDSLLFLVLPQLDHLEKLTITPEMPTKDLLKLLKKITSKPLSRLLKFSFENYNYEISIEIAKALASLLEQRTSLHSLNLSGTRLMNNLPLICKGVAASKTLVYFYLRRIDIKSADWIALRSLLIDSESLLVLDLQHTLDNILENVLIEPGLNKPMKIRSVKSIPHIDNRILKQSEKNKLEKLCENLNANFNRGQSLIDAIITGKKEIKLNEKTKPKPFADCVENSLYTYSENGDTLLHLAVKYKNEWVVQILIDKAINPWLRNKTQETALDLTDRADNIHRMLQNYCQTYSTNIIANKRPASPMLPPAASSLPQAKKPRIHNPSPSTSFSSPSLSASNSASSLIPISPSPLATKPNAHAPATIVSILPRQITYFHRLCQQISQPSGWHWFEQYTRQLSDAELQQLANIPDSTDFSPICLLLGVDQAVTSSKHQVFAAHYLYEHKADIKKLFFDPLTGRDSSSLLHMAASRNNTAFAKWLSRLPQTKIDAIDDALQTPLHIATALLNEDLVDWLISCDAKAYATNLQGHKPIDIINNLLESSDLTYEQKEIAQRLQSKLDPNRQNRLKYPAICDMLLWVKPMQVCYGGSLLHKTVELNLEPIHHQLAADVKKRREENPLNPSTDDKLDVNRDNLCAASITFVISDRPITADSSQHGRRFITLPLVIDDQDKANLQHYYGSMDLTNYDPIADESTSVLRAIDERIERLAASQYDEKLTEHFPSSVKSSADYRNKMGQPRDFHALFHHSEQALFAYLEQKEHIDTLIMQLKHKLNELNCIKLYAVILSVHSERYMCDNCGISALAMQLKKSLFMRKLIECSIKHGFILPSGHQLVSLVTVTEEKEPGNKKMTDENHDEYTLDIRRYKYQPLILSQDINRAKKSITLFSSRK